MRRRFMRVAFYTFLSLCVFVATTCKPSVHRDGLTVVQPAAGLRPVRVLVAQTTYLRLQSADGDELQVASATDGAVQGGYADIAIRVEDGHVVVDLVDAIPLPWTVRSLGQHPIQVAITADSESPRRYRGALQIAAADEGLSVLNLVDLEDYVESVVASETWPTFLDETFRVQAIIARTYVVYQMLQRESQAFDVSATQSSQVYQGVRDDPVAVRARQATIATHGLVSTWDDNGKQRVFCAYYSASCGGLSQSASIFGPEGDVPPLAGGVACEFCKDAPGDNYRWKTVRIPAVELYRRLCERYPDCQKLSGIRAVRPTETTASGRIVRLQIDGDSGESVDILGERFRMACGATAIRSMQCSIRTEGNDVLFENGRGFGHGLGLCQWGAQGQAKLGKRAGEIIRYYFPDSRITRIY